MDWKHVLLNIVNVFGNSEITVDMFLIEVQNPTRSANMFLTEEYSSDEELQQHVQGMNKARNLALEGMPQYPATND